MKPTQEDIDKEVAKYQLPKSLQSDTKIKFLGIDTALIFEKGGSLREAKESEESSAIGMPPNSYWIGENTLETF